MSQIFSGRIKLNISFPECENQTDVNSILIESESEMGF